MRAKTTVRFRIDFTSKWLGSAAFFGGLGFFLLCVFYFGFTNLFDLNILQILFQMLLPMAVLGAVVVLLHVMRYDSAQLVIALAGAYSLLMLIRSFTYGGIVSIILGVVWYALSTLVCLLMLNGALRDKGYLTAVFLIPAVFRAVVVVVFRYILTLELFLLVQEMAMLSGLISFGMTAMCMEEVRIKRKDE